MAAPGDNGDNNNKFVWDSNHIFPRKFQSVDQSDRLNRQFQNLGLESNQKAPIPEGSGESLSDGSGRISMQRQYPIRPDAIDCVYFVHTGRCKYGSTCKFNHPVRRNVQGDDQDKGKAPEILSRKPKIPCKFYLDGLCIKGDSCRFYHQNSHTQGLPLRPDERQCSFYTRTCKCAFKTSCMYHHADPSDTQLYAPYVPGQYGEYQDGSWGLSEPYYTDGSFYYQPPSLWSAYKSDKGAASRLARAPEFVPQRPHEENMRSKELPLLSDVGLPLRPEKKICWFYENLGLCKFGKACAYDHPPRGFSSGENPENEEEE